MYDFVVQTSLAISLIIILYLFARALPRLSDLPEAKPNVFDRVIGRLPLDKMDSAIASFSERILRKSKILVMKADHLINGYITKIKLHEEAKQKRTSLKEKMQALTGSGTDNNKTAK